MYVTDRRKHVRPYKVYIFINSAARKFYLAMCVCQMEKGTLLETHWSQKTNFLLAVRISHKRRFNYCTKNFGVLSKKTSSFKCVYMYISQFCSLWALEIGHSHVDQIRLWHSYLFHFTIQTFVVRFIISQVIVARHFTLTFQFGFYCFGW